MSLFDLNSVPDTYKEYAKVLNKTFEQVAFGKGKERHVYGHVENFEDQVICEIPRRLAALDNSGADIAPLFQAIKKIYESRRLSPERAIHELYGAINYIVAAIILRNSEISNLEAVPTTEKE